MFVKFLFLFSFFVFAGIHCNSQNKEASFYKRCSVKTINYEQGLLNNGTTNIITDDLGFTWISTKTGMQRNNGYTLETVNPVINKETININAPVIFFLLKNGLLWISYKDGILEYDVHKNFFRKVIAIKNIDNINFSFIPMEEINEGIIGIQNKMGLVIYSPAGKLLKNISNAEDSFINNVFNHQEILNNTKYAFNNNSIFIYNGKDKIRQTNFYTHQNEYINAENCYSFTCSNTNLYIISNSDIKNINITNKVVKKNIPLRNITGEGVNRSACYLLNNNLLLISLNTHLYQFDTSCTFEKEYTNYNLNPVGDPGFIRAIYTDKFKRIWLLTNDNIKRIQNFDIPFEHFIYKNEKNNFVRSLYYDKDKNILLAGCYNGGIQLFDTLGNALWQSAITSDNLKDINAIEKLDNDNYFIETISRGLYIINLLSKKITPFLSVDSISKFFDFHEINFINNLQRIDDSTLYIATSSNVFKCIIKNKILQSALPQLHFKKTSQQVDCFIYTRNKTLWTGTVSGSIYRITNNKSAETIYIPDNYQIRTFTEDAKNNIWVGTDKGLYVYDETGAFVKSFTMQSGLLNDCIYALLPTKNSATVFASSNVGLSNISLNGNIINYTKESGLQENEFNTGSAIKTANGKFYFGGVNGITAFYSSSLTDIIDHPVLNITRLSVNDSLFNFSGSNWKNDSIILNYDQNHVQLDLGALGLLNTNEYKYQYRLKGFEEKWQTTHQPTGIKYILSPGNYVLEVRCSPIFSSESIFKKSFTIIISPAWWQTLWFKILLVLVCIGIIVLIVQQYSRRRYLQQIHSLEMQQQIQQERERISRDLHDNLGAYAAAIAANVSDIKMSGNKKSEVVFDQLNYNSQSIINQLNDTIWALNKEEISFTKISDRFKVFIQKIQPNFPKINIEIKEEITNDIALSPSNALHLFRIMQEAVNNALKHSNCYNVSINIISRDNWEVIIKDDGKGMPVFVDKQIQGNGLQNIRLRCQEAGWKVKWRNEETNGTALIISPAANTN